ncbi:MAG: T9SS type A sorting domain-containing protein [bacterium]
MKKALILLISALLCVQLFAIFDEALADGNRIGGYVSNFGVVFQNNWTGNSGLYWPKEYPEQTYVFGSGIWFGGLLDTAYNVWGVDTTWFTDTLATVGYNPGSGVTEMVPGDSSDNPTPFTMEEFHVYTSNEYDWPFDTVYSDFDTYCIFNDLAASYHFTTENIPLKIVVEQFTYQFNATPVKDVIFLRYRVINRNSLKIRKAYFGFNIDNDIGNEADDAANDLLGFITDYDIGYEFQLESEAGWVTEPGVIGWSFVQGPVATDTVDVYHDNSKVILPGDTIGMTCLNYFTIANDPYTKELRYLAAAGYNHTIYNPLDPEASYSPFPMWGEGIEGWPGETQDSSMASDKRFLISSGPFDLDSYDTVDVVLAVAINLTPDSMVNSLLAAKEWWVKRDSRNVTLINPADKEVLDSPTNFTWSASLPLPEYTLSMINRNTGEISFWSGSNTFSHLMDPVSLDDGIYRWSVANYDSLRMITSKSIRHIVIDNSGINGAPCIYEYDSEVEDSFMNLSWHSIDPEGDMSHHEIMITDSFGGEHYYQLLGREDTTLTINLKKEVPNGYMKLQLFAYDDSMKSDTADENIVVDYHHHSDEASIVSGNSDAVKVECLSYDNTLCTYHTYEVRFDWPYDGGYSYSFIVPFSVVDININDTVLVDTAYFGNEYYSGVFDGLGLKMTYTNDEYTIADSVKIITDIDDNYPDSLLHVNAYDIFGGRNITINWHESGDSLYADYYPEGYSFKVPYGEYYGANYFYGGTSDPTDYILESSASRTEAYILGTRLFYNYTYRTVPIIRPMDTLWVPEEGEVWKIYSSGPRLPIKGDIFRFTPTGLKERMNPNDMLRVDLVYSMKSGEIMLSLTGEMETVDVRIYDIQGRAVKTLFRGSVSGSRRIKERLSLPSGVYFIKEMNGGFETKKILMIK